MFGRNSTALANSKVETIIGRGTEVKGTIQSNGVVRIDGQLEGAVQHSGELIVGPKGVLIADVHAKAMAIAGEVRGDLAIEGKLELLATARVQGNIRCGNLVVHEGAKFQGQSNMLEQPGATPETAPGIV